MSSSTPLRSLALSPADEDEGPYGWECPELSDRLRQAVEASDAEGEDSDVDGATFIKGLIEDTKRMAENRDCEPEVTRRAP